MVLIVSPLSRVQAVLVARKPSHVLTLLGDDADHPACGEVHHRVLRFNDIALPMDGLTAPSAAIVREILDFGQSWRGAASGAPLLVHCYAGISRSTAAAYILACTFAGPGREQALADRLRAASPTATPNSLMIALADKALSREGRMIGAVKALGRGAFAAEGVPFDLIFD